jgi:hypothetical protein
MPGGYRPAEITSIEIEPEEIGKEEIDQKRSAKRRARNDQPDSVERRGLQSL